MNCAAFSDDSILMMYEAVRGALAADDAAKELGVEPRFKVRETAEWRKHADDLEAAMIKRGMYFAAIDWHERRERNDGFKFAP
jgi:hypothetical protein